MSSGQLRWAAKIRMEVALFEKKNNVKSMDSLLCTELYSIPYKE